MNSRLLPLPFDIDNGCRGLALREKDEEKVLGVLEQLGVQKIADFFWHLEFENQFVSICFKKLHEIAWELQALKVPNNWIL